MLSLFVFSISNARFLAKKRTPKLRPDFIEMTRSKRFSPLTGVGGIPLQDTCVLLRYSKPQVDPLFTM